MCLKSNSNLGENWGKLILAILKISTSNLTFLGGNKFFFAKVPQLWSTGWKGLKVVDGEGQNLTFF